MQESVPRPPPSLAPPPFAIAESPNHLHADIESDDPAAAAADSQRTLADVCADTHARVAALLNEDATARGDMLLAQVQAQTRVGLGVVAEALRRFRCVLTHCCPCWRGEKTKDSILETEDERLRTDVRETEKRESGALTQT